MTAYILLSLTIAIWAELETGEPRESSARRMGRMAIYAALWPVMLLLACWYVWVVGDLSEIGE